jgi:hypothetical protein
LNVILDATTRKIQIVLAAAVAANQLPVVANYVDTTATATTPGSQNAASNSMTAVDVVAAPAASTQRIVQSMSIQNADTANATVTVRYNDNGTTRDMVKVLLNPGQSLVYTARSGWQVVTATQSGAALASFRATKNGTDQTGIASGVATKISFTAEDFDIGSYYDATNSKWTPPAGKVLISIQLNCNGGVVAQNGYVPTLYKNGVFFKSAAQVSSGAISVLMTLTVLEDANGTDYYEVYFSGFGAGNKTISGAAAETFFQGTRI